MGVTAILQSSRTALRVSKIDFLRRGAFLIVGYRALTAPISLEVDALEALPPSMRIHLHIHLMLKVELLHTQSCSKGFKRYEESWALTVI